MVAPAAIHWVSVSGTGGGLFGVQALLLGVPHVFDLTEEFDALVVDQQLVVGVLEHGQPVLDLRAFYVLSSSQLLVALGL